MPEDIRADYEAQKIEGKTDLQALDAVSETPKGKAHIESAVEALKTENIRREQAPSSATLTDSDISGLQEEAPAPEPIPDLTTEEAAIVEAATIETDDLTERAVAELVAEGVELETLTDEQIQAKIESFEQSGLEQGEAALRLPSEAPEAAGQANIPVTPEPRANALLEGQTPVYGAVAEQLRAAMPEASEEYIHSSAILWDSFFRVMGERAGIKPDELFSQYRVKIARDYLTKSKRAGKAENVKTLADFIRDSGGISAQDEHLQGELRDRFSIKEGYNLINNKSGKTLDLLAEAAWEAGYFSERPTVTELLDSLREDVDAKISGTGQAVFAREDIDAAMESELDEEYKRYLEGHGEEFQQSRKPSIIVTGKELGDFGDDIKALREAARKFYKENLQGEAVKNLDLGEIRFTRKGLHKSFSASADPRKLKLFAKLPEILAQARLVETRPNEDKKHSSIKAYHWLETYVDFEGKALRVGITVFEDNNGNIYYNHTAEKREGSSRLSQDPFRPDSKAGGGNQERGKGAFNPIVANDPDNVNLALFDQAARGRITFKLDGTFISLLKDADASTFLHESAHLYFRVLSDLAKVKGAKSLKTDLKAVLDWLKVDSVEKMEVKHYERWARGFEKYLAEGKAPSVELRAAFAQFKAWLVEIYKQLKGLKVNLSDDVRSVMDRMLATKEEIATKPDDRPCLHTLAFH